MAILTLGSKLFHVDGWMGGQTDMAKLIVAFRNFAKVPKNKYWELEMTLNYENKKNLHYLQRFISYFKCTKFHSCRKTNR
jgi:hypothetical protein